MTVRPPRLPDALPQYDAGHMQRMIDDIQNVFDQQARALQVGYQMTNVTKDRVLDADSTSTAELADLLGTLIEDLIDAGVLGR